MKKSGQAVFLTDVQTLQQEASKRRNQPLKEALDRCVASSFEPELLFHAFVVGCEALKGTKFCTQCVSCLGKMATLRMLEVRQLPLACVVLEKLLDLVDEELQLRVVQTVISFCSACEFAQKWIEEPLSFIYFLFVTTKSPIIQAACSAAITQTSHSILDCLKSVADTKQKIETQMQAVIYYKDVCAIASANQPKWLKLKWHPIPSSLQLLLLGIMTSHVSGSGAVEEVSPLFAQCLNEDLISLLMSAPDSAAANGELFSKTQKLGVTSIVYALHHMAHTAPTIISFHSKMIAEAAIQPWRMALVLSLWRKAFSDYTFLDRLLDATMPPRAPSEALDFKESPVVDFLLASTSALQTIISYGKEGISVASAASPERVALMQHHTLQGTFAENKSFGSDSSFHVTPQHSPQAGTSAIVPVEGESDSVFRRHPAEDYVGVVLDFITMVSQSLCRLLESHLRQHASLHQIPGPTTKPKSKSDLAALITAIAPSFIRSCSLAMDSLTGEDVIHAILKCTTHLVHCCCLTDLSAERDQLLAVLCDKLAPEPQKSRHRPYLTVDLNENSALRRSPDRSHEASPVGSTRSHQQPHITGSHSSGGSSGNTTGGSSAVASFTATMAAFATGIQQQLGGSAHQDPRRGVTTPPPQGAGPPVMKSSSTQSLDDKAENYQRRVHILSSIVSIASGMGNILGDGWKRIIAACLTLNSALPPPEVALCELKHEVASIKEAILNVFEGSQFLQLQPLKIVARELVAVSSHSGEQHVLLFASECCFVLGKANQARFSEIWPTLEEFWVMAGKSPACTSTIVEHMTDMAQLLVTSSANKAVEAQMFSLLCEVYQDAVSSEVGTAALRNVHQLITQNGQKFSSDTWNAVLRMLKGAASRSGEDATFGFRIVEVIQHGHITQLGSSGLLSMITCVGAFIRQRAVPDRININLSAVQLVWSIADYFVASDGSSASAGHWNSLLMQLKDGCVDSRHEVRHSALKSLFSLVVTHGSLIPKASWGPCIWDVLLGIIRQLTAAVKRVKQRGVVLDSPLKETSTEGSSSGPAAMEVFVATLINNPKQFDEIRAIVSESCGRIFRLFYSELIGSVPDFLDALDTVISFCSDCCETSSAIATPGEETVLVSTRALHSLLADLIPRDLPPAQIESIWCALERIAVESTTSAAITAPVLSVIVEGLGEMLPATNHKFSGPIYLQRYFGILEHALNSEAIATSYYFPSKVHMSLFTVGETLVKRLESDGSRQSLVSVLLAMMPTSDSVTKVVEEDSIKVLPKACHPNVLGRLTALWASGVLPSMPRASQLVFVHPVIRAVGVMSQFAFLTSPPEELVATIQSSLKTFLFSVILGGDRASAANEITLITRAIQAFTEVLEDLVSLCADKKQVPQIVLDQVEWFAQAIELCSEWEIHEPAALLISALVPATQLTIEECHLLVKVSCETLNHWTASSSSLGRVAKKTVVKRNRSVIRKFLADPSSKEAERLLIETLQSLTGSIVGESGGDSTSQKVMETVDITSLLPLLAELVTTDSSSVRVEIQKALMAIFDHLGFGGESPSRVTL